MDPGEIGDVTGTRKKAAGKVDVAMLQTLTRATDLSDILPSYGQVIIDECHHIPAASFELVLKQLPARFVLGLTATPYRKDGLQKIIHFQCGPIRSELATADGGALAKQTIVRETEFRLPPELGDRPPVHVIWHYLSHDERRNNMIAGDVAEVLAHGRTPLVISDRKDHLQLLGDGIRARIAGDSVRVLQLDGSTPVPARRKIFAELESALAQEQKVCLLSTASLIGEGFDLPALDTLFLALPISFKGRMVQYVGRLHRLHEGKSDVRVYDYVDSYCAMTLKMYRKRLVAYRNMGYSVVEPPGMIGASSRARPKPPNEPLELSAE